MEWKGKNLGNGKGSRVWEKNRTETWKEEIWNITGDREFNN